ncbi:response regulator [Rhizobium setariae]|uniref:response regulator n=1 Tax=Rhizobium setariae TaxID=2801340 RepID=UPI0031BB809F
MAKNGDSARIIVVDDEEHLREMVAEYLAGQGFDALVASGGRALDALMAEALPDLILLDVNMPEEDGFSIARRLRARGKIPVIMVTAADDVVDRIVGLEVGADDYVTKPFDLRELKARIRAVLRRTDGAAQPAANGRPIHIAENDMLIPFGKLMVDREGRRLTHQDGTEEPVTSMEFDLIEVFLANPYRVLSRDRLLELAHRKNDDPFDRSIDIRVTRLRKKIEEDPSKPQTIKTVRGAGYIYSPPKRVP